MFHFLSLLSGIGICSSGISAEDQSAERTITWSLQQKLQTDFTSSNPCPDDQLNPVWYFLRTTRSEGPVETRTWHRDGRYAPLTEAGKNLFGSPLDGWALHAAQPLAPAIGRITAEYDIGLKFNPGDILIAPGPDHAAIVAWRSPVSGRLEIQGSFEHGQSCCGTNSKIRWYVERGPAPDEGAGFTAVPLASGESDFGTPLQLASFHIRDQLVQPDDYVYFIVDALSDQTATPHFGDGTRLQLTISVHEIGRAHV